VDTSALVSEGGSEGVSMQRACHGNHVLLPLTWYCFIQYVSRHQAPLD
jgi:hypothetical protein